LRGITYTLLELQKRQRKRREREADLSWFNIFNCGDLDTQV